MTKAELIEEVARITELPRKEAAIIVEHILDSMVHAIARGDKVEIRGFGSFHKRPRRARIARNPKPAHGWKCLPSECRFSSPAGSCATS